MGLIFKTEMFIYQSKANLEVKMLIVKLTFRLLDSEITKCL